MAQSTHDQAAELHDRFHSKERMRGIALSPSSRALASYTGPPRTVYSSVRSRRLVGWVATCANQTIVARKLHHIGAL